MPGVHNSAASLPLEDISIYQDLAGHLLSQRIHFDSRRPVRKALGLVEYM